MTRGPLAEGWDSQAGEWTAWARRPGRDTYERFHRDLFLPLVPAPGRLTVDLGCGEGRVSRDLTALGHRVIAADLSQRMCRATATHPECPVPVVCANAGRLPLRSGAADCVVAFMSLHDIDDMPGAIREAGRVLEPDGRLVMATVHPLNSAGSFLDDEYVITDSYLRPRRYVDTVRRDDLTMTFHGEHRPMQAYTEALADAGFVIERLLEPTTPDPGARWHRIPLFLNLVARTA